MCKNHLLIFSSFLDIWENVEWPRFIWTTLYIIHLNITMLSTFAKRRWRKCHHILLAPKLLLCLRTYTLHKKSKRVTINKSLPIIGLHQHGKQCQMQAISTCLKCFMNELCKNGWINAVLEKGCHLVNMNGAPFGGREVGTLTWAKGTTYYM